MTTRTFDAGERIAGFRLPTIRSALLGLGYGDDSRDDVGWLARGLECDPAQAARVLVALEGRGFVRRGSKENDLEQTELARELCDWQPTRCLTPAVEADDDGDSQGLETVPSSVLRYVEEEHVFEDADFEVGVWTQYAGDRLVELSIIQPDDYENRERSGIVETSVYLGVARRLVAGLTEAIALADAVVERRAKARPARARTKDNKEKKEASRRLRAAEQAEKAKAKRERLAAAAQLTSERELERRRKKDEASLQATLKELESGGKAR